MAGLSPRRKSPKACCRRWGRDRGARHCTRSHRASSLIREKKILAAEVTPQCTASKGRRLTLGPVTVLNERSAVLRAVERLKALVALGGARCGIACDGDEVARRRRHALVQHRDRTLVQLFNRHLEVGSGIDQRFQHRHLIVLRRGGCGSLCPLSACSCIIASAPSAGCCCNLRGCGASLS